MKNQKGSAVLVLILLAVVVSAVFGFIVMNQKKVPALDTTAIPFDYQVEYQESAKAVAPVKNTTDLDSASTNLETTDTTQLDTELNALGSTSSSF